jgi:hypothetical protein
MDHRIASARPLGRTLTATLAAAGLWIGVTSLVAPSALAQQKPAAKPAGPAPQPARPPAGPPPPRRGTPDVMVRPGW